MRVITEKNPGNWLLSRCHECGIDNGIVAEIGEELSFSQDFQSATALICKPCLLKALELIENN